MRRQISLLLLSVLLSIPLGMKATIVDDPDLFNFSPFYDEETGIEGLALTFFPSEEGDTVYIPDYIYENNQYKYVVCINTGAFIIRKTKCSWKIKRNVPFPKTKCSLCHPLHKKTPQNYLGRLLFLLRVSGVQIELHVLIPVE